MKRTTICFFFFLLIFSQLLGVLGYSVIAYAQEEEEVPEEFEEQIEGQVYVLSGDIIKNFKMESLGTTSISGNTHGAGNRLKVESGGAWKIGKEDVQNVGSYKVGNKVYMYYKVAMHNDVNVYTNVQLDEAFGDASAYGKTQPAGNLGEYNGWIPATKPSLKERSISVPVGHYKHKGCLGPYIEKDEWKAFARINYYNFGNIRTWNAEKNTFSGNLKMSFDIAQSPLPNIFKDSMGNNLTKDFDHIAVSSAVVESSEHGKLSEDQPEIEYSTPDYESSEVPDWKKDLDKQKIHGDFEHKWNPDYSIKELSPMNTFEFGINAPSGGSSLNPTLKNGDPIFDPKDSGKSMENCRIKFNVGRLSPVVFEYGARYTWKETELEIVDDFWSPGCSSKFVGNYQQKDHTITLPTAIHVQNRYIQTKLKVVFNVWTQYTLHQKPNPEDPDYIPLEDDDLELPQEYYDNATWTNTIDGFGGGTTYEGKGRGIIGNLKDEIENVFGEGSFGIFLVVGVAIVIGSLGIYLYGKVRKARRTEQLMQMAIGTAQQYVPPPRPYQPPPQQPQNQPPPQQSYQPYYQPYYYQSPPQQPQRQRRKEKKEKRKIFKD